MYKKQELLLGVLNLLNRRHQGDNLTLMKVMFLISKELPSKYSCYHFHPYKFGPFSSKIYSDLNYFAKQGWVVEKTAGKRKHYQSTIQSPEIAKLTPPIETYIENLLQKHKSPQEMVDYVYQKYPEYACRSEWSKIPIKICLDPDPGYFLIGYEGRDIDAFLHELILHNIEVLIDVRYNPRSMKYEFNRKRLAKALKLVGIDYLHIPELGISGEKRKTLETQKDYEVLFNQYRNELPQKEEYIARVITLGENKRIALMCFERSENQCHRGEIGKYLNGLGKVTVCL